MSKLTDIHVSIKLEVFILKDKRSTTVSCDLAKTVRNFFDVNLLNTRLRLLPTFIQDPICNLTYLTVHMIQTWTFSTFTDEEFQPGTPLLVTLTQRLHWSSAPSCVYCCNTVSLKASYTKQISMKLKRLNFTMIHGLMAQQV